MKFLTRVGFLRLFLVYLLPNLPASSLADSRSQRPISDRYCQKFLMNWLRQIKPQMVTGNSSLLVDWSALDKLLEKEGCVYQELWLELWRLSDSKANAARNQSDFGTVKYLNEFERCKSMDGFIQHDWESHKFGAGPPAVFRHVVEQKYVLRVCPCRSSNPHVCDCGYNSSSQCSGLFTVIPSVDAKVFDWCLPPSSSTYGDGTRVDNSDKTSFLAPVSECPTTTISGTTASCTPIQDYDEVVLKLHRTKNNIKKCDWTRDHNTRNMSTETGKLTATNANRTEGEYKIELKNLTRGATYCVTVELKNHPYCKADHTMGEVRPVPRICSTHIREPIRTNSCVKPNLPSTASSDTGIIIGGVAIATILVIFMIGFVAFFKRKMCSRSRAGYLGNNALARSDEEYTLPNGKGSGATSVDSLTSEPLKLKPAPTLVLYFHESQEYVDLNRKLVAWMRALMGPENVTDMSEEALAETLSQEQEGYVTSKLDGEKGSRTRVLVLNSPTAVQALRSSGSEDVPLATSDLDQFYELKVFALKRVKALYTGNYKQVLVAAYSGLRPTGSDIEVMTPHRKQCVLPEQTSEVQNWLLGSGPVSNASEVAKLEEEYATSARRFLELTSSSSTSSDDPQDRGASPNVLTV